VPLSDGQRLALVQLAEIVLRSEGALEVLGESRTVEGKDYIWIELSLATRHYRRPEGLAFRDRERLRLAIHDDFPFRPPWLYFAHKRFLGAPHVQWGSYICLFQSTETEWQPSDGMFGYLERVDSWFAAAGAGKLDPEDAPLHPPAVYTGSTTKFVMKADTPALGASSTFWLGRAELVQVRSDRYDAIGWTEIAKWDEAPATPHVAAAILLAEPMPFEYPSKFTDLYRALEQAGVSLALLVRLLRLVALMTDQGAPAHVVIGAPMRRKAAGEPLRQHLTVWEIEPDALATLRAYIAEEGESTEARDAAVEWMAAAKISWCRVLENRPEVVYRRDIGTLSAQLLGKRILLLGCGALGSAIAEQVARAGAIAIGLADNGLVKPGLLVRQRYGDADIGRPKVDALCERLDALRLGCTLSVHRDSLKTAALSAFDITQWDLVIDATASSAVGHTIERELATSRLPVPLVRMTISAGAAHGSVAVKMPGYGGGPVQIARQAKLSAFQADRGHPAVKAFWPGSDEIEIFQPEPGCSDPTFTGSAADLDYHAGGLLNRAVQRLATLRRNQASVDLLSAPWLSTTGGQPGLLECTFGSYRGYRERRHRYGVLFSPVAEKGMRAEIDRIARVRSCTVETGGLMFGEINDAHRHIWIDSVSGPPPDSEASAEKFLCGTAGTVELARFKAEASGGSSRFVGIWHTHPVSRGSPSDEDLRAMAQLLFLQPFPPRQVVMLIVGFAATRPQLRYYLYHRHDFSFVVSSTAAGEEING
jgi:proteasome lid subunit RPN8/RPN11